MLVLAWVMSLVAVGVLGYWAHHVIAAIRADVAWVKTQMEQRLHPEEPTPTIIDGNDPLLIAKHEYEERFKRMNDHVYDEHEQI